MGQSLFEISTNSFAVITVPMIQKVSGNNNFIGSGLFNIRRPGLCVSLIILLFL